MSSAATARRLGILGYAILAYSLFVFTVVWAIGFFADLSLPTAVDHHTRLAAAAALSVDAVLLLLFAVQHSTMARASFKRRISRWVPPAAERSTYVLAASIALIVLFGFWQPVSGSVWRIHDAPATGIVWAVYALGWLVALSSTFMIDHVDFVGLRQALSHVSRQPYRPTEFKERWLYARVRHPMMLGLLVTFWATPRMTAGHLVFAIAASGYIAVGLWFEERDLDRDLGDVYRDYARRVPSLLPFRLRRTTRAIRS